MSCITFQTSNPLLSTSRDVALWASSHRGISVLDDVKGGALARGESVSEPSLTARPDELEKVGL